MPRVPRTLLEVERKFLPDAHWLARFTANRGPPPFRSIKPLGTHVFEDAYFDRGRTLFSQGIWLRQRNGAWQAKVRRGGDFRNSQFAELADVESIRALVAEYFSSTSTQLEAGVNGKVAAPGVDHRQPSATLRPPDPDSVILSQLDEMARFITTRHAWTVDGRFSVVLDETDFGHRVGEVELEVEVPEVKEEGKQNKPDLATCLDHDIESFMKRYSWAFPEGEPVGKLSAYFIATQKRWE